MTIKPTHKPVKDYYAALAEYGEHRVTHETAVRSAFQNLLADSGKRHGWFLVPEESFRVKGKDIRPDGTLLDEFNLHRGYWEAKDTDDNLDAEIRKKVAKGYPLINTIFEDTRTAVLFQDGDERMRIDLSEPQPLCDLLNEFFAFTEPNIGEFNQAVDEFKERVPDIAKSLVEKIAEAHQRNTDFQEAFDDFFTLCQQSLNPNIAQAAVDEMLVQHLLTERLIRTVFDQQDFVRRNVIAAEVEKVIDALTRHTFSRHDFLKSLDRFYRAIELAAGNLEDFSQKQHFLNTVYERFFQGYSVKVADTHGIVYTPQEIVDFMCASVAEVLKSEFGLSLGAKGVHILDPCTGTGNFVVNLLRRIPKRELTRAYREQLFANEVMLLPYYIAALNIEHAYYELTGKYDSFEGLCFVDTLDLSEMRQQKFEFMNQANAERVDRQKKSPVTVIVGNPPYNVGQLNENDNNKNRKYPFVERRIRETYARDSAATNKKALSDSYVKFFRWAVDRIEDDGIVCFVSNNSFVDQIAFGGMRRHLIRDFTRLYHIHLEGNVRHNPTLPGTTYNVFGIQVGVGITIAVRHSSHHESELRFARVDKDFRREEKLAWLSENASVKRIAWEKLKPDDDTWLPVEHTGQFTGFVPIGSAQSKSAGGALIDSIFETYSRGLETTRDSWVYDNSCDRLTDRVQGMMEVYNADIDRWKRANRPDNIDSFVTSDATKIKWSSRLKETFSRELYAEFGESSIRDSLYRPFNKQYVYFDSIMNQRTGLFAQFYPDIEAARENKLIGLTDKGSEKPFMTMMCAAIADLHIVGAGAAAQCFPFYVYNEDGTNRRENITDWALAKFREEYVDEAISKWDIFYYVYGILHHPGYREKFADNLKRELPRIPLAPSPRPSPRGGEGDRGFRAFAEAGKRLAELHLNYETLDEYPLTWIETPDVPLSYRVEKMKLSRDKASLRVNESLTLDGIPPAVFEYRLGNRSALDWVIDQYRVKTDKRSGITSDPNRADDAQYIVRLVGQVIGLSLETVEIVSGLPEAYSRE